MNNILIVQRDIENLNMKDKNMDVIGLLKTDTTPESMIIMFEANNTLDDILNIINSKEKNAVYVSMKGLKLKDVIGTAPIDYIFYLNNKKFIKFER